MQGFDHNDYPRTIHARIAARTARSQLRMNLPPDHPLQITYAWAKRIVAVVAGFTVLAIGIVMLVTPGPAIVVIPIGLGILSLEFAWAKRWLDKIKSTSRNLASSMTRRR